jgi:hypothetical protein
MRTRQLTATMLVAAGLTAAAAPAARADETTTAREAFPDAVLRAYARAVPKVLAVYRDWEPKFAEARGDRARMRELRKQAERELVAAIERTEGIGVEQYKRVSMTARTDRDLYQRLKRMVERVRAGKAPAAR